MLTGGSNPAKDATHLGWRQMCDAIAMAKDKYNGDEESSCDTFKVFFVTRWQWLGSHEPQYQVSPC